MLPPARCALTAPFHPYLAGEAVYSLLHFPWTHIPQALPGTLSCGARTFLPRFKTTGDCPANSRAGYTSTAMKTRQLRGQTEPAIGECSSTWATRPPRQAGSRAKACRANRSWASLPGPTDRHARGIFVFRPATPGKARQGKARQGKAS